MTISKKILEQIEKVAAKDKDAASKLLTVLIEREIQAAPEETEEKDAAADSKDERRIKKFTNGLEKKMKDMQSALDKYSKDPAKYRPQLDNLARDLTESQSLLRRILDVGK